MKKKINRYINYVKEAFFNPVHLMGLGIGAMITVVAIASSSILAGYDISSLLLVLGGLDMLYLGIQVQNPRFIRAVNAKYSKEIQAFHKTEDIAGYYNNLTLPRQRRFEVFMKQLEDVKVSYEKIHSDFPNIVNSFLSKLNNLQLNYVRLLFMQDKAPSYTDQRVPNGIKREMDLLLQQMKTDKPQIQKLKSQRVGVMKKRLESLYKAAENAEAIGIKLQTIEEMVALMKDQPMALQGTGEEELMIDNILFESQQMQDTISDLEAIINTDVSAGGYGDLEGGYNMEEPNIKI